MPMLLALRHFPAGTEGQTYWYHLDGRGSVAGLTKHQGQSTHNYRYDAYGQLLPAQGNFTDPHNPYTFAGKSGMSTWACMNSAFGSTTPGLGCGSRVSRCPLRPGAPHLAPLPVCLCQPHQLL